MGGSRVNPKGLGFRVVTNPEPNGSQGLGKDLGRRHEGELGQEIRKARFAPGWGLRIGCVWVWVWSLELGVGVGQPCF